MGDVVTARPGIASHHSLSKSLVCFFLVYLLFLCWSVRFSFNIFAYICTPTDLVFGEDTIVPSEECFFNLRKYKNKSMRMLITLFF